MRASLSCHHATAQLSSKHASETNHMVMRHTVRKPTQNVALSANLSDHSVHRLSARLSQAANRTSLGNSVQGRGHLRTVCNADSAASAAPPLGDAPGKVGKERPSFAEESRTLIQLASYCHLSTASVEFDGHPYGSMVDVACDSAGRPVFAISQLSAHTKDLQADARASVTVTATNFSGINDARVTVVGICSKVERAEEAEVKEAYMAKHPEAFWVEFADFSFWRMDNITHVRYVGGFGRAGSVSADKYSQAEVDPVQAFTPMIAGHMNDDHKDAILAMLAHYGGAALEDLDDAAIVHIDRLGMDIQVKKGDDSWKQRLGFVRGISNRKEVKDVLVEMTKTAAKAAKAKEDNTEA